MVIPLLKKPGLESLFKNLRPVSNLAYISKLTGRSVFNQIYDHLVRSGLYPLLQSAYRRYHSTETALVKLANDILLNINSQRDFGIGRKAVEWFSSYLSQLSRRVLFEGTTSDSYALRFGVPQGSFLGLLLFAVYASKLFEIVQDHLPNVLCFADDTQLYLSFDPNSPTD